MEARRIAPFLMWLGCSDVLELPSYQIDPNAGAGGSGGASTGRTGGGGHGAGDGGGGAGQGAAGAGGVGGGLPCKTLVSFGEGWIPPDNTTDSVQQFDEEVGWDGECLFDGNAWNATLSNGWAARFSDPGCAIAIDHDGECEAAKDACSTRVGYLQGWVAPEDHPNNYDLIKSAVLWDGQCVPADPVLSVATLSGEIKAVFEGPCHLSLMWSECGGLYRNPIIETSCPGPSVFQKGADTFVICGSSDNVGLFPIFHSTDLIHFEPVGHVFEAPNLPTWADGEFSQPELHEINGTFYAYFGARSFNNAMSLGVATSPNLLGPYIDGDAPIVETNEYGAYGAHPFLASNGERFLFWAASPSRILGQELASDGRTLLGDPVEVLTSTLAWEGGTIGSPWVVERGGSYYLFYRSRLPGYPDAAVGVGRSLSPLGPFQKVTQPIVEGNAAVFAPDGLSLVVGSQGDDVLVYGARSSNAQAYMVFADHVQWSFGAPTVYGAPSLRWQPVP